MKEDNEEGEKVEKARKKLGTWWSPHLITLWGEIEFEFTKNARKQGKFQLIETLEFF
jgi:hypothetical protein